MLNNERDKFDDTMMILNNNGHEIIESHIMFSAE